MNEGLVIQKVGNGWLLIWPQEFGRPPGMEDQLRWQARIMKEEITGDDELKNLTKKNEEPAENEEGFPFKLRAAENIFIFRSKEGLTAFLTTHLK